MRVMDRPHFCPEMRSAAVGSRRSRAAAFGDETIDEAADSASHESTSFSPDVQASLTSSGATVFSDKGEQNG